jgi:hypothetical protein
MTLTRDETLCVREAEEQRTLAMQMIDRGMDTVILAQLLGAAGELYSEAGVLLAKRAKVEAKRAKVAP